MSDRFPTAGEIAEAIVATCPGLGVVATPKPGLFGSPVLDPGLYPDSARERGYYVPVPPPAPFKVAARSLPVVYGQNGGRPWTVMIFVTDAAGIRVVPTLTVTTYARLARPDVVPFSYLPWLVATLQPTERKSPVTLQRPLVNPASYSAKSAVGQAVLLSGGIPVPSARPPVRSPMILATGDPLLGAYLESYGFLERFAAWERRAGDAAAEGHSAYPVLKVLANDVRFTTRIDPAAGPAAHAATVHDLLEIVPELERAATGKYAESDPIPTLTFTGPPGSVPDVRPAYPCPKCGQLEILKLSFDRVTGLAHKQTLNCGVDIFPPFPNRVRDVQGAASTLVAR